MADDTELLVLVGRLDRLLKETAPRIEIYAEHEYVPLIQQHIHYVSTLSRLLRSAATSAPTEVIYRSAEILRQRLPEIELAVYNRNWETALQGSYEFAASPFTEQVIAAAEPLPVATESYRAVTIPSRDQATYYPQQLPAGIAYALEPLPGGGGEPVVIPRRPPPPPGRKEE